MKKLKKTVALIMVIGVTLSLLSGCSGNETSDVINSEESGSLATFPANSNGISEETGPEISETLPSDNVETVVITGFTQDYVFEQDNHFYFPVEYSIGENSFTGYMDDMGIITPSIPTQFKKTGNTSELYDNNGAISYTHTYEDSFDGVKCGYNGTFLWRENQSDIDGKKVCLGLMDCNGAWLYDGPVNVLEISDVDFDTYTEYEYLGEDMFSAYDLSKNRGNLLLIFNANTGKCISIENVYPKGWAFYDGTMIYQQWDGGQAGGYRGKICLLHSDGTIQELNTAGDFITANKDGFLTTGSGISFYDRNGNLKWTFDKYEIAKHSQPVMYDDFVFVCVRGADGKTYTISLNSNGEIVFDPFETCSKIVVGGHYALKENDKVLNIVDLTSGSVNATINLSTESYQIEDLGYEDYGYDEYEKFGSLFIIKTNGEYSFYDIDGEQIVPTVE